MAGSNLRRQLTALLKRNILVKRRNLKQTIQEILYPVYMVFVLAIIRLAMSPKENPAVPHYPEVPLVGNLSVNTSVLYAWPNTSQVSRIMSRIDALLPWPTTVELFDGAASAERRYAATHSSLRVLAGVGFKEVTASRMNYSIRMSRNDIASTKLLFTQEGSCRSPQARTNCPANTYYHSGFVILQRAIDTALREESTGVLQPLPEIGVQQMPKPSWQMNIMGIQMLSSLYLVMAFSPIVNFLCINLVSEKEKGIRENMRMMGLHNTALWLSWVITYGALIIIVSLLSVAVAVAAQLFHPASAPLLFICLVLYGFTLIGFAHILAPLFRSAQVAGMVASLLSFVFALAYLPVSLSRVTSVSSIPVGGQWALCLLSPTALALAVDQGIFLDIFGDGMTFSNIGVGHFPIYGSVIMLIVDFLLYSLFAAYLDTVIPGEFGQNRRPWFFLLPSFWRRQKLVRNTAIGGTPLDVRHCESESMEDISPELQNKNVIRMNNLRKVYPPGKKKKKRQPVVAVDGITLDIYEGQITAILGHNGAGKTTLFNMLTGLAPVTSGAASIYDLDVTSPSDQCRIREMTGVCPQGNILFDDLTCREHLVFYAHLKGVPDEDVETQAMETLKNVDMSEQAGTKTKALSGGQKRKLSVGIALIGDPKVIFLDEPTSGMDPYSRRHLWSFLKASRADRVILLTTHFMDEADILADRKVFISQGKLKCVGSSLFLKNRFGLGYHMAIIREPSCDVHPITELVQSHVSTAAIARCQNQEVTYTLPLDSVNKFADLFGAVEQRIADTNDSLGIHSFGITMTTLEEVFLKIGVEETEENSDSNGATIENHHAVGGGDDQLALLPECQPLPATSTRWLRLRALMRMRALIVRRKAELVFGRVILPLVFIIIAAVLQKFVMKTGGTTSLPPLALSPLLYARSAVAMHNPDLVYSPSNDSLHVVDFVSTIQSQGLVVTELPEEDLLSTRPHYIGLAIANVSIGNQKSSCDVSLLYNGTAVHSLPVLINVVGNSLLKLLKPAASISVSSHPWPASSQQTAIHFDGGMFGSTLLISMALVVLPATFGVSVVKDREVKARALLRISGVTMNMYWLSTVLVDLAQYLFVCVATLVILLAFQVNAIMTTGAIICIILLFVTYAPLMMICAYAASFAFNKHETAQMFLPNFFIFVSLLAFFPVFLLDAMHLEATATTLHTVLTIINPPYAVYGAFYYIERLYTRAERINDQEPVISVVEYFRWKNNVAIVFIASVVQAVLLYFVMRLLEIRSSGGRNLRDACPCHRAASTVTDRSNDVIIQDDAKTEDSDVQSERSRVMNWDSSQTQPSILVKNLRKEYITGATCKRKKDREIKVAVNNNSFAVEAGEVFGLLGPNGAGKTTTLNMIIAEETATSGKVYVSGHDVTSNLSPAFSMIGYCPQHDALWEDITLREHLECYAAVQGLSADDTAALIGYYIKEMQLSEHADKSAKALSGGTKRKLSYIISMLGKPSIVLMDEPSTGMDPKSKRFFWTMIQRGFSGEQRGAILTTHYMEEADTLCTRIAIMVNGRMQCIGTSQHLKNKFGSGYVLEVKLSPVSDMQQAMNALRSFLEDSFVGSAEEVECFGERATYKIAQDNVGSLSHAFKSLEQVRSSLGIEDYSLSQCTLEQVFIQFAKQQQQEDAKNTTTLSSSRPSPAADNII